VLDAPVTIAQQAKRLVEAVINALADLYWYRLTP
jgi:hypothetical protein